MQKLADLRTILEAKSVAVIGASADPLKVGGRPIEYLRRYGFSGRVVAVNPKRKEIQGIPCVPSLTEAEPVDLAIIAAAAEDAQKMLDECITASVKAVIIFTAGFAELSEQGRWAQRKLAETAATAGIPLLGPNCLGAINTSSRLVATFTTALEPGTPLTSGPVSYLGQSGALGAYWIDMVTNAKLGFSKWVTTGNEAQLGVADALNYLASDPATRVIAAYIEDIKHPELFAYAASVARAQGKTILSLSSGSSIAGRRAVSAHTGANAANSVEVQSLLLECGAIQVHSVTELVDVARVIVQAPPSTPTPRLGIVTVSGGAGALISDAASLCDLDVPDLPNDVARSLEGILPTFVRRQNPIDVTAAVVSNTKMLGQILQILAASSSFDTIIIFVGLMASVREGLTAELRKARTCGKPIVVIWMGCSSEIRAALEFIGIPVFADIPAAITTIAKARTAIGGHRPSTP